MNVVANEKTEPKESLLVGEDGFKCRVTESPVRSGENQVSARPQAELAALYGTTERTLRRWKAEGVDIQDPAAVEAYRAILQPSSGPTGSEEIKELKAEKLRADTRHKQAQAERAELLLFETKGELVRIADVAEANFAIASQVKGQLLRLEAELPPKLEGLAGAAMTPIIRESIHAILVFLADTLSATAGESRAALHE